MKNLKFDFDNYDKVINLNTYSLLLLKQEKTHISAELIYFKSKEENYEFKLDKTIELNSINAILEDNRLFLLWHNLESNVILSIFKVENSVVINKKQLIISYDYNKLCKSCNFSKKKNRLTILWFETDYYSNNEYSKFDLNKHLYEVEETSSEIYLNLIRSEIISKDLELNCKYPIFNSTLTETDREFFACSYQI